MTLALIAAQSKNHIIGNGPDIPWRAKGEQKLFKDITMGGILIMGRKTFDSIGRALPGRETIVVSRQLGLEITGCHTATSLPDAVALATSLPGTCFIAGGGEIYRQAVETLELDEIHLTTIDLEVEGDVFMPDLHLEQYQLATEQHFETNLVYHYQHYIKPSA